MKLIKKTNKYIVGTSSATAILGSKVRRNFDSGLSVEVNNEQFETLVTKLRWAEEVPIEIEEVSNDG